MHTLRALNPIKLYMIHELDDGHRFPMKEVRVDPTDGSAWFWCNNTWNWFPTYKDNYHFYSDAGCTCEIDFVKTTPSLNLTKCCRRMTNKINRVFAKCFRKKPSHLRSYTITFDLFQRFVDAVCYKLRVAGKR